MTPQSARRLASLHASQSRTATSAQGARRRKRETVRRALRRVKDEPRKFAVGFGARRMARRERSGPARPSKRTRAAMLVGGAAMTVAANSAVPFNHAPVSGDTTMVDAENFRVHASKLSPSPELLDAIVAEEGMELTVYSSVIGNPLVGAGHLVLPDEGLRIGDTITKDHAMRLLRQDAEKAAQGVRELVGDMPLYQHEFDALVDLAYNVGIGKLDAEDSPRLNAAIDTRDHAAIAAELDYTSAKGTVFGGLEHRSDRRAQIFAHNEYGDTRTTA
ncbi:lysozyme [Qipengyuania sp. JC766]|uniref:lysozyme n=1 Tax=Qipengyuania sp. JC766 TaxID=3232139 RepID=UPI00345B37C3